ncbi:TPA: hypothetical protein NPP57_003993, partial [Klebsiella pneumoniae]|nr:hypothetical protein [Klebsiella pneumoniae]
NNTRALTQKIRKLEYEVYIKPNSINKTLTTITSETIPQDNEDIAIRRAEVERDGFIYISTENGNLIRRKKSIDSTATQTKNKP